MNPYKNLTTVFKAPELMDFVFHRASKVSVKLKKGLEPAKKARLKESYRIKTIEKELTGKLNLYIKSYPNFDTMSPFYLELTNVLIDGGVDRIRLLLASLSGIIQIIKRLSASSLKKIHWSNSPKEMARIRLSYYGRISSIIKKITPKLNELIEFRNILRKLPSIDTDIPTIVVAGYPNVGKSSLVKVISTARPEISYYPFTTKKIIVGKFKKENINIQIIDSPGLLDRPLSKRNRIEMQAILALRYLAKSIIFMIDPSETCGYPLTDQISLFNNLIQTFVEIPFIIIQNKIDLYQEDLNLNEQIKNKFKVFKTNLKEQIGIQKVIN
ncbi:MAG: NOG1 family protein, partial [Candidatus Helarchaeota archaeon]